jgi:hypothetical protein
MMHFCKVNGEDWLKYIKQCIRKKFWKHKFDLAQSLRKLKSEIPKNYWNILNKKKKKI